MSISLTIDEINLLQESLDALKTKDLQYLNRKILFQKIRLLQAKLITKKYELVE